MLPHVLPLAICQPVAGDDCNAPPAEVMEEDDLTERMKLIREYTEGLAQRLIGKRVRVVFVKVPPRQCGGEPWDACSGRGHLLNKSEFHYNAGVLGKHWFDGGVTEKVDDLILHEFGHEYQTNHLDHRALTKLAARLKRLALEEPEWFRKYQVQ